MNGKRILWRGLAPMESRDAPAVTDADLALINQYVPDGEPRATLDDVYVRSAMVCNDMVDHYSTRFTPDALRQIATLLPCANVMRNHNEWQSGDLPIGRIYFAELVTDPQGVNWVRAKFYWEKGTEHGDAMARKIALGIWREVSLSWWMESFTNNIDGKPFDESPYYPGQELPDGQTVIGIMDDVVEVNEVSIVARGGQKNTSMGPARKDEADDAQSVRALVAAARSRVDASGDVGWFERLTQGRAPKRAGLPFWESSN